MWTYDRPTVRPHHRHINVYSHTFYLIWEPRRKLIAHQCCDQLTSVKTGNPLTSIIWPYRGLRCRPIEVEYFLRLSADKLLVFKWSQAQVYFLKFIWNTLCLCNYGPALLRSFFQTNPGRKNSASYLKIQVGKTFFTMATLYVQLLCPDWSKFDRWAPAEDYAASWNLFTLTAEADILLCQLVIFLTVFFHWMCKMKYSCYQESSVIHGWFVYWVFGWEMRRLSKSEIMHRFRFSPCLMCKRV